MSGDNFAKCFLRRGWAIAGEKSTDFFEDVGAGGNFVGEAFASSGSGTQPLRIGICVYL